MRVALQVTCVNDALFPGTGQAVVTLLRRLGVDVEFPQAQTCCGQPWSTPATSTRPCRRCATLRGRLRRLRRVVTPSGSCAGSARHQHAIVARRSRRRRRWSPAVAELAPKVYELSEFLVDVLGVERRRRLLPARGDLPPDLPLAAGARRGRPPAPPARAGQGLPLVDLPAAESAAASAAPSR